MPSRGQYGPSHLSSCVNPSPACLLHSLPPPLTSAAPSQISLNPPPPFQLSREYCSIQRRIGTGCISGTHCPAPSPKFTNTPQKNDKQIKVINERFLFVYVLVASELTKFSELYCMYTTASIFHLLVCVYSTSLAVLAVRGGFATTKIIIIIYG